MRAVRLATHAIGIALLASCSNADPADVLFHRTFDETFHRRYPETTQFGREECESSTLSQTELLGLIADYNKVDSLAAYQVLVTAPCLFDGDFVWEGRAAHFLWYPTGYLRISYPDDPEVEADYYICPGGMDDEGIFHCAGDMGGGG